MYVTLRMESLSISYMSYSSEHYEILKSGAFNMVFVANVILKSGGVGRGVGPLLRSP